MARLATHSLLLITIATCVLCKSYLYGDQSENRTKIHREKVISYAIPWRRRVESYFYNDTSQRIIKGIACHDYQRSEATVNITDGGIGYPYVGLLFQSQRSYGLEYAVELFA